MTEEGKSPFQEHFSSYGWAILALVIAVVIFSYLTYFNTSDLDGCIVTKEWIEEAFDVTIEDKGKNHEVRDGKICITNETLLKEIYDMVG